MRNPLLIKSTFAVLLGCLFLSAQVSRADIPVDAQVQCLTSLAWFEGINPGEAPLRQAVQKQANETFSFSQLQQAARDDGMQVISRKMSFAELRQIAAPAIVRLNNPNAIVTVAAIGTQNAIAYEGTNLQIMPVKVLSERYGGEALLYEHYLHQQPQVIIEEPVRDVKITTMGGAFPFSVPVQNTGNKTISLKVQRTSCGCTSDDNSARELQPGQSGELHFKTTANSDRVVTAMIATSDPARPVFVLAFQISVPKTTLPMVPGLQLNGGIGHEITSSFPVKLPPGITITKVATSEKIIAAKLLELDEQKQVAQIGVTISSHAPAGSFSSHVMLFLKGGDITQMAVPVEGYINADVYFTPAIITLDNSGKKSSYEVTLQSPVHQKFAIVNWETTNPAIQVKAQRNMSAAVQHITVQIHTMKNAAMSNGRIVFTLSDGRQINLDVINSSL